jgi:Tfp pilus assembly ATPase PilU
MARSYSLNHLLERLLGGAAGELHVLPESPPYLVVRDDRVAMGSVSITNDNIADLLGKLATVDQMRELNACGDVQFIYLFRNWVRFSIVASIAHGDFSIRIKNLGRWSV